MVKKGKKNEKEADQKQIYVNVTLIGVSEVSDGLSMPLTHLQYVSHFNKLNVCIDDNLYKLDI